MNLNVGTPLWKLPTSVSDGVATNTLAVLPAESTDAHSEFVGVTVRDRENSDVDLHVQRTGDILVRVMGPCAIGDLACQAPGSDYLAVNNGQTAVGRTLQAIAAAEVQLIRVRTGSPGSSESSSSHPFQINRLSDSTVSISAESFCLKGLNAKEQVPIWGLGVPFTVLHDTVIYLEFLFDINLNCFQAGLCAASSWGGEFPRSIKTVQKTANATELAALPAAFALRVGPTPDELADLIEEAEGKLALFANQTATVKQWAAYVPVAFATEAEVDGLAMVDGETPFVLYQCLKTHLMLASFCDAGVPCMFPIASAAPIVERVPDVQFTGSSPITISVPSRPDAVIYYTLDGSTPSPESTRYTTPVAAPTAGQTLKAVGVERARFASKVATYTPA